jgi:hypothetical protein
MAVETQCFPSKGEMRKTAQGGGVSLNKEKLAAFDQSVTTADLIDGRYLLVQKGKPVSTKKEDIQGQWVWWEEYLDNDSNPVREARLSYKFEGDRFEMILVAWGQKYTGTYTYENKVLKMKFGKVYNYLSMTGTVTASTSGAQVLFEAGKFLEFAKKAIKVVGAGKDNSTLSTIAGLSDQVTGLKLGFDMKK